MQSILPIFSGVYCGDLEKAMAPYSSTLAWKIPWMEEPGMLQSMGLLRVRHDWASSLSLFTFMHWRGQRQPTPVFLPGESQGLGSLVGCRLQGCTESDITELTQQQQHCGDYNYYSVWTQSSSASLLFYKEDYRENFNSFPNGFILPYLLSPTLPSLFYKNSCYSYSVFSIEWWCSNHVIQCLSVIHHTLENQKY